jgi:hypothetical protein
MRGAIAPEAAELVARYPAIASCRVVLEPIDASAWNARVELLLPQHQVVVNAAGESEDAARRRAIARADEALKALLARDPQLGRNANC